MEVHPVLTRAEKRRFLTFPWQIYRNDPLWVPPLLAQRTKATDPARGHFFRGGYAEFFAAYRDGRMAGTICCSHEIAGGPRECSIGFFECVENLDVAEALFQHA